MANSRKSLSAKSDRSLPDVKKKGRLRNHPPQPGVVFRVGVSGSLKLLEPSAVYNGETYPVDWQATDEMDNYLQKIDKILIIRMQNKKPIEGYDTSLLHLKDAKAIELE
jgi:hypothetical protein